MLVCPASLQGFACAGGNSVVLLPVYPTENMARPLLWRFGGIYWTSYEHYDDGSKIYVAK